MSLAKLYINDGGLQRAIQPGDVAAQGEIFPAANVSNALTVTGAILAQSFINRTPTGAAADTIDNAANIIAAIVGGLGFTGLQNGTTWRTRWHNNAAFAITVAATANTGVTVNQGTVNASSSKEFLVTVNNGSPASIGVGNSTNASPIITGMSSTATSLITVGQVVTNAVAGLQGATVIAVNPGVGVTLSANANATGPVSLNFSPSITLQGLGQGLL